jgi:quercetin dioxygenase-like cupin family protein
MEVSMDARTLDSMLFLDRAAIELLPWEPVPDCPGVYDKELWRDGDFVHALIRYEPGATSPGRPHLAAHHHLWVISGSARIGGRSLTAGSYAHIPPDMAHRARAGPHGCVLLQLHLPHARR